MRKPQAVRSAGNFSDDALRHRLVEGVVQCLLRKLAQVLENLDAELSPERRGDREELSTRFGEACHTASNDLADAGWDLQRVRPTGELALRGEKTHDLADEERISCGLSVNLRDRCCFGLNARGHRYVVGDVVMSETAEGYATRYRLTHEFRQGRSERVSQSGVDVAVGDDDEHSCAGKLPREESKEK